MSASSNATLLADLFDPEVVGDYIDKKLVDAIRLAPLAEIDDTLVGRAGDELSMPYYNYIGDAEDVAEGTDIPIAQLHESVAKVKVSKIGKAVEFSDEAMISGNGNIAEEAAKQIVAAVDSTVERKLINNINTNAVLTHTITSGTDAADGIADALTKFGEDIDGAKFALVSPQFYAQLRKANDWIPNTDVGADIVLRGAVGQVHGCQIVTSNRMYDYSYTVTEDTSFQTGKTYYEEKNNSFVATTDESMQSGKVYYEKSSTKVNEAIILKPGALRIVMKRNTLVEFDRDILAELNYIKGSKLFAPYLYDSSKAIKVNIQ